VAAPPDSVQAKETHAIFVVPDADRIAHRFERIHDGRLVLVPSLQSFGFALIAAGSFFVFKTW